MSLAITPTAAAAAVRELEDGYGDFEAVIRARIAAARGPLFTTSADPEKLWAAYLDGIPADRRQHYNCHSCRRFIQRFGGLAALGEVGSVSTTLIWGVDVPPFFLPSVVRCGNLVAAAKVTGVFLSSDATWGTPTNAGKNGVTWSHLSGVNPRPWMGRLQSAEQAMAEKRQDFQMLVQALVEYPAALVVEALRVLTADALTRSEKALGVAQWLAGLHARIDGAKGAVRSNLIWLAVATAPPGFCHVRSTIISTLLDDIKAGLGFDAVSRRWGEKLHPLQYQRPQAAPTAGQIDRAEKIFEALNAGPALARRFATLEDVLAKLWMPTAIVEAAPAQDGVFGHLRAEEAPVRALELPAASITWEKFARTVLPSAAWIDVRVPAAGSFYGLVTAADPAATPVIQWDGLQGEARNPVSWYFYVNGSPATAWGLRGQTWAAVTAVFLPPHQWQQPEKFAHQGQMAMFAVEGCREMRETQLCLFPEILKAEFREVRAVIERHSQGAKIAGAELGTANGIAFQKGNRQEPLRLRVRSATGLAEYNLDRLDRWD